MTNATWSTRRTARMVEMEVRECSPKYEFPGTTSRSSRLRTQGHARRSGELANRHLPLAKRSTATSLSPARPGRAFLMRSRRVLHLRPRHRRDRPRRTRHHQGWRRNRNVGISHPEDHCTGVEMFRKLLAKGQAGDNVGVLLRGHQARRSRARPGIASPAPSPAHQIHGEIYVLAKDEGAVTPRSSRLSSAVLSAHRRDARSSAAGTEMSCPATTSASPSAYQPIAMEEGLRFAISRRRTHRRCGRVAKIIE